MLVGIFVLSDYNRLLHTKHLAGDYEDALQHLQVVTEINPNDVTATARAGLINVKINRYKTACQLLSNLTRLDRSGLKHVIKALDATRRRRLCEVRKKNS